MERLKIKEFRNEAKIIIGSDNQQYLAIPIVYYDRICHKMIEDTKYEPLPK